MVGRRGTWKLERSVAAVAPQQDSAERVCQWEGCCVSVRSCAAPGLVRAALSPRTILHVRARELPL